MVLYSIAFTNIYTFFLHYLHREINANGSWHENVRKCKGYPSFFLFCCHFRGEWKYTKIGTYTQYIYSCNWNEQSLMFVMFVLNINALTISATMPQKQQQIHNFDLFCNLSALIHVIQVPTQCCYY